MERQQHKLLLPLGDQPVVAHVVEAVLASQAQPILVVLGHQAEQVRAALAVYSAEKRLIFVENPEYKQGMSTSLRAGLQAMNELESAVLETIDGAIVLLGDQPLITAHIIDMLIAMREETAKKIVAPLYNGRRGNPVLFDADLFSELMTVTGDEGGRSVIEHHRQDIATVEVGDSAASSDVDTWSAYQEVVADWQRQQERREK
jgi:molybdenum cofactor cytidylyltransferase